MSEHKDEVRGMGEKVVSSNSEDGTTSQELRVDVTPAIHALESLRRLSSSGQHLFGLDTYFTPTLPFQIRSKY